MLQRLLIRLPQPGGLRGRAAQQEARAGSLYLILALGISGVLTYVFQALAARALGPEGYGLIAILWSATFLFAQVLWIGTTQTLGRYVAEREARHEDWAPVIQSARRLNLLVLAAFLLLVAVLSPWITAALFSGRWALTAAFALAIAGYAFSYFRRGVLSGHRQFARLSGMYVAESLGRVLVAAALLWAGMGVIGPAVGIALAPLLSVWLLRPAPVQPPVKEGDPFHIGAAFRFAAPVLVSMACAQLLANGGPLLIGALGGADAQRQAGLLVAGLMLTRAPQYVLSPAITNLLPHLSRMAAKGDYAQLNLFVWKAGRSVGLIGVALVAGTWLLGPLAMRLLYGPGFRMDRGLLAMLAALAAFYLLCEFLNQVLYARGLARLASLSWLLGIVVTVALAFLWDGELLRRVSYALALGTAATALALALFHLATLNRHTGPTLPPEQ